VSQNESAKSVREQNGVRKKGSVLTEEKRVINGPLSLSPEELPKYGLRCTSAYGGRGIHRIQMGSMGSTRADTELQPACERQNVERQEDPQGHEYRNEWKKVVIERVLPFDQYKLCGNPGCFRHVEIDG
jgi:hypothetical protein